ncbi:MAG: AAA family ATPase [Anaerolineales bacterium]|jgi:CO dehydrogenase maturation factor
MTKTIALAGKGGTGKTTLAALLIQAFLQHVRGPILAIDADPASNLHMALGMPLPETIGQIREGMSETAQAGQLGVSISRHDYLNREVMMALEEGNNIDLLSMGRPEGQGCYCAVNHLLRQIIDDMGKSYPYIIIDNEAGMEHISRRTTRDVDMLVVVTDPSARGMRAAADIIRMAGELEVNVKQIKLVVNRVISELPEPLTEIVKQEGLEIAATIPADERINHLDAYGEPLVELNGDSPALKAVQSLASDILNSV